MPNMTKQVIAFICECGNTYPDEKSAKICEDSHLGLKKGWLKEQLNFAQRQVRNWPEWKRNIKLPGCENR